MTKQSLYFVDLTELCWIPMMLFLAGLEETYATYQLPLTELALKTTS